MTGYEAEKVRAAALQATAVAERGMNDFLAHEVRNPLSVAVGGLRFVESALSASTSPEVIADLKMARVALLRAPQAWQRGQSAVRTRDG